MRGHERLVDEAELRLIRKVLLHYAGVTSVEATGDDVTAYALSYEQLAALPSVVNGRGVHKMLHADRNDLYVGLRR